MPIYETVAEREAFLGKLQASSEWSEFQEVMASATEPRSRVLYRTMKNWGEIVDTDHVWMAHAFRVRDPAGFVAALDKLMGSPTGKKFPGQAYLSAVVFLFWHVPSSVAPGAAPGSRSAARACLGFQWIVMVVVVAPFGVRRLLADDPPPGGSGAFPLTRRAASRMGR